MNSTRLLLINVFHNINNLIMTQNIANVKVSMNSFCYSFKFHEIDFYDIIKI